MRRAAHITILGLVAALAVVLASTAYAETQPPVQVTEAGSALFPDRAYVVTLAGGKALTTDDVTVTEDGRPVEGLAVQSAASAEGIGTVLLIDASNSMKKTIGQTMEAARTFAARNPGQPLSVVFFNAKPTVALPFTTNRKDVKAALARNPQLAEGTALYDALSAAVAQIRGSGLGAARIVLITDGDDVGSVTSLDSALAQLDDQKVRVFTVGIESTSFTPDDLEKIAAETGAAYAAASSPAALKAIYGELGFRLGNEYLLLYRSTARPDKKVDVEVAVKGVAQPVAFSYTTPATGTGGPYRESLVDKLLQSWLLLIALIALLCGLVYYAVTALLSLRSNRRLRARLGEFVTLPEEEQALERRKEVDALLAAVGENKQQRRSWRLFDDFAEDVDVAQIAHEPRHLVWGSILVGLVVAVLVGVLVSPVWVLLFFLPPVLTNAWVRNKARRVRNQFAEQLPENLDVLASALRAGHSLASAMEVVATEAAEPSKREFRRVVTDEQLGIPLDEALEVTAKRMQSTDMDQVAVLALLQREAGGNTAEVLDQVIANIRARMDLRRLVNVLTSQGKFSSVVIAAVPIGILAFILAVNPDQLQPLFDRPLGQAAGILAIAGVLSGFYLIRRIVTIEL
jgi:tight adherence protein B